MKPDNQDRDVVKLQSQAWNPCSIFKTFLTDFLFVFSSNNKKGKLLKFMMRESFLTK